jgi:ankyrin repeat protein
MGEDKSSDDGTPFGTIHQAASRGRIETKKVLLESGADPDGVDQCGWGPLHFDKQLSLGEIDFLRYLRI